MLYVSRKIGVTKVGVVDTDDNVETILTLTELQRVTCELGLHVEGVTTMDRFDLRDGSSKCIHRVNVYVPPENVTTSQTKLKVLLGVEVKVNNNRIVSVSWSLPGTKDRVVRLSDYAGSCGSSIFWAMKSQYRMTTNPDSRLTFILDDNLALEDKTFKDVHELDVVLDVREVTNKDIVTNVYKSLLLQPSFMDKLLPRIIDNEVRKSDWTGIRIVNHGIGYSVKALDSCLADYVDDVQRVTEVVKAKYKPEFLSLAKTFKFELMEDDLHNSAMTAVVNCLYHAHHGRPALSISDNFDVIWDDFSSSSDPTSLQAVLYRWSKTGIPSAARRLINYLTWFEADDEIKAAFVKFYRRAMSLLMQKARERGWVR